MNDEVPVSAADILESMHKKGVRLWCEGGRLRYEAPDGILTQDDIARLRVAKQQIVAFLERYAAAVINEPTSVIGTFRDWAPLAFSQIAHWNLYQLRKRPRSTCLISAAARLRGSLDPGALKQTIAAVVQRHHALRTRIGSRDGQLTQEIHRSHNPELMVNDLRGLPEGCRERESNRLLKAYTCEPMDVCAQPPFKIGLVKIRDDEHVLITVMEHIIGDGQSRDILMQDIQTAYRQIAAGGEISLRGIRTQFADYAVRQRVEHAAWIARHSSYWDEHLLPCPRVRFPADGISSSDEAGGGIARFQIPANRRMELSEWSRRRQATPALAAFCAYAALVMRWCDVTEVVIAFEVDGRRTSDVASTIGYFAAPLYLRINLQDQDNFLDLLTRVVSEFCKAHAHADDSFMESRTPRPEFTRNSCFNWLPGEAAKELDTSGMLTWSPIRTEQAEESDRDTEPMICLLDTESGIEGSVKFQRGRYSVPRMQTFARNFPSFLHALLRTPTSRVKDIRFVP